MKHSVGRIIFRCFCGCLICYVLFTLVSLRVSISRKEKENQVLQQAVEEQKVKNEETQKTLDENDQEELIRRFAENQGYAYQGEKIFIDEAAN